jgi:GTP cyclohydrolase I
MHHNENVVRAMPDVANEAQPAVAGTLEWVGMGNIDVPVTLAGTTAAPCARRRVSAYVNLRRPECGHPHVAAVPACRQTLSGEPLTPCSIGPIGDFPIHAELSDRAMVRISFDHLVRRPALKSDNSGWKSYPLTIAGAMDKGQFSLEVGCEVVYSSTCPCSAALARQLIQERFGEDFARGKPLDYDAVVAWLGSEQGICATPHSQRSIAEVRVKLAPSFGFPIVELIDRIEDALQTPVQTAVKREDEQAFALLNGENLMFCEDAARRIRPRSRRTSTSPISGFAPRTRKACIRTTPWRLQPRA